MILKVFVAIVSTEPSRKAKEKKCPLPSFFATLYVQHSIAKILEIWILLLE